jgi:hypothetical protein
MTSWHFFESALIRTFSRNDGIGIAFAFKAVVTRTLPLDGERGDEK